MPKLFFHRTRWVLLATDESAQYGNDPRFISPQQATKELVGTNSLYPEFPPYVQAGNP